jgi:long-chain acyl-CoA synthetase
VIAAGDLAFKDLLERFKGQQPQADISPDDLAIFQYTGGTTGPSKAAVSTHRAIISNAIQQNVWLNGTEDSEPGLRTLGALPFFHVFGMISVVLVGIYMRSTIVLVPNARDIDDVIDLIQTYQPPLFPGVPALYNAINVHPDVVSGKADISAVKKCFSGSAPLPRPTKETFEKLSGARLMEGYGMSEAPTASHANPLQGRNITGSVGLPLPDTLCKIVSVEDPNEVMPVGDVGEIAVSGPQLMSHYHGRPTATKNTIVEQDGRRWLLTGDIGYMDEDGYFYIVDRKKDMALIGGFNVYPNQVDQVLNAHPAVAEVATAIIPHPEKQGQEALKAWIVLHPGMSVTVEELMTFAGEKLARYEIPSRYEFIDALPRTSVGKILRRVLIQQEVEKQENR